MRERREGREVSSRGRIKEILVMKVKILHQHVAEKGAVVMR